MPNRMRRALYVKDDDYRYSFLHGHFVTLTNLSDHDWQRIAEQALSPLYVSVHATDRNVRRACLRNSAAPDIMEQLRWLAEHDIEVHTQVVITPGLNDGPYLGQSIRELATLWPHVSSVCVVPVGLTKHHKYDRRSLTKAEMRVIVDEVRSYQQEYLEKFGVRFVYLTDEWYLQLDEAIPPRSHYDGLLLEENGQGMVRRFLDDWRKVKREVKRISAAASGQGGQLRHTSASLATGALFAPTLTTAAQEFTRLSGLPVAVIPIVNERLGETITVSGLLMGDDVINQLRACELGEVVVLPRIMFDHPQGIALDDVSPLRIAQLLDRPVALADTMGDVLDALTGHSSLMIKPTDQHIPLDVMKAGGWSVEKYL
jgi:putative radical SAM enzyme (TIGR03279 family)